MQELYILLGAICQVVTRLLTMLSSNLVTLTSFYLDKMEKRWEHMLQTGVDHEEAKERVDEVYEHELR
jgi:hypothetical protein